MPDEIDACPTLSGAAAADAATNGCPPPDAADARPSEAGHGGSNGYPAPSDESSTEQPPDPTSEPAPAGGQPGTE